MSKISKNILLLTVIVTLIATLSPRAQAARQNPPKCNGKCKDKCVAPFVPTNGKCWLFTRCCNEVHQIKVERIYECVGFGGNCQHYKHLKFAELIERHACNAAESFVLNVVCPHDMWCCLKPPTNTDPKLGYYILGKNGKLDYEIRYRYKRPKNNNSGLPGSRSFHGGNRLPTGPRLQRTSTTKCHDQGHLIGTKYNKIYVSCS